MLGKKAEYYIKQTFDLAKKGAGFVSPNPMVGAVLVKNDKIIGQGYHQKFGEAHAEVNAIESASEAVLGSTLYCNLEPCCHLDKKTPPCAQKIIKEGIKRVVISNLDPNPKVSGKGIYLLKNAGIEVEYGILEDEGKQLNRFFFKYIQNHIPFISVKIAQTLDGKISEKKNTQSWITGFESQKLVHKWRSEYDAVLVGAGTIAIDNPQLTVRHVNGRNPFRIILDDKLQTEQNLKIFESVDIEKTIIVTSTTVDESKISKFDKKDIRILKFNSENDKINLESVLKGIGKIGIASIMVEGGGQIFSQFISENLFDELNIFVSPKFYPNGMPAMAGININHLKIHLLNIEKVGSDLLLTYLPQK